MFHLASSLRANAREYSKCNATHIELKLFVVSVNLVSASLKGFEFVSAREEYIKPELKIGGNCGIIYSCEFVLTKI
jgi:hypothetical protein